MKPMAAGTSNRFSIRVMSGYAELHCHTNFSFLEGASHPEDLVARATELGLAAVAVTDHNGLYGAPRFAQAARQAGLPAIVGAEMEVMTDGAPERQSDRATEKGGNEDRADFAPSLYRSISPSFHLT